MKKALIITYYWPPAGGSGVQRWLKFTKYFRKFNIEPIIYTVKNTKYPLLDPSLEKDVPKDMEVIRKPIWEPNNTLFSFFGNNKTESAGFLDPNPNRLGKILHFIRANYFIPDARKFWVRPSLRFLREYLKENHVDVVITSGPPHSVHLIGLGLKEDLGVKWIADFRDPWTEIDYFHQLPLTRRAMEKHLSLERKVLSKANVVLVVGNTMREKFKKINPNTITITNGYDGELETHQPSSMEKFTLTHVGMMNSDRNPVVLWEVLSDIILENEEFKNSFQFNIIGKIANSIKDSIENYGLVENIHFLGYLPHSEVLRYQKESQVLLLVVNRVPGAKGIVTGKVFEYLMVKRPILAIGPTDGDLAEIINETQSGVMVDFHDKQQLKEQILELYTKFKEQKLVIHSKNLKQYHRKELTKDVSEIINNL